MHTNLARTVPLSTVADSVRHALSGPTMGTRYAAIFYAAADLELAPIAAALRASVETVDRQMSTWTDDSDLMRFNRAAVGDWVDAPAEMLTVIGTALEISRASGGAFDIGVGDLVGAWGFSAKAGRPDAATGRATRRCATPAEPRGDRTWIPLAVAVRKLAPVSLDLSGIAKGFGVDRLAETLERFGIDRLSRVDRWRSAGRVAPRPAVRPGAVGGRTAGPRRDAISPASSRSTDGALATSGDYRHCRRSRWPAPFGHTHGPAHRSPAAERHRLRHRPRRRPACWPTPGPPRCLCSDPKWASRLPRPTASRPCSWCAPTDRAPALPHCAT